MWDTAFQIALAHLAASLIPGQSLALVSTGIAANGIAGGMRAVAGITAGKSLWALGMLALLPLVLAADPSVLTIVQLLGGAVLALVGLTKLLRVRRRAAGTSGRLVRRSFAGTIASPTTCVFFLSGFPLLVGTLPAQPPSFGIICLAAIAATTALALVPWFALGLAARRLNPEALRIASGVILLTVGASLLAGNLA